MIGQTKEIRDQHWPGVSKAGQPVVRLFCFPYAGGSSYLFKKWRSSLPGCVEVRPVELPGRGARTMEPPLNRLSPLVDFLIREIRPLTDRPFAFFGHSMGALLSFEIARRFRRENHRGPLCLFVSGNRAPHIPLDRQRLYELPDAAFVDELRRLNGTPGEVLDNSELMELLLPILRADFSLCETYSYSPEPPLDCSIVAFGGSDDVDVTKSHLEVWREQTTGTFALHMLCGDHFFMHDAEHQLLAILSSEMMKLARAVAWQRM